MKFALQLSRAVALVGFVTVLLFAAEGVATGVSSYFPLQIGNSWEYTTKKHTKISQLFEVNERDKHGTVERRVLRASRLSTKGLKVFAVRNTIEERGSSIAPLVTVETILHMSSSPRGVFVHALDTGETKGQALPEPIAVLEKPPSTEPVTNQTGTLRMSMSVKSQKTEAVKVPAGKFAKALKQVVQGPISGALSGLPVRSGIVTETSWFVPGVGLVRRDRTLDIRVADERGVEVRLEETAEQVLEKFSTGKSKGSRN